MYILFIDTHYTELRLALFKNNEVWDQFIKCEGKHSEIFIPLLEELLEKNCVTFDDLSGIIIINGPGSFPGVRIGVVVSKLISYCKSVPLKVISYLQALALKYDNECLVGFKDRNGMFVGRFDKDHELIGDYFYLCNQELEDYPENIIEDEEINLDMVYQYLQNKSAVEPHFVKPIYVKKIEVDND